MIRSLRAFFLSRALREKFLLVGFAVLGVLMWLSNFSTRAGRVVTENRRTNATLREQKQYLDSREAVELAAQKAAAQFDPAKTYNAIRLQSIVQTLATEAGMKNPVASPLPRTSNGQFSVNSLEFKANIGGSDAEWQKMTGFYKELQAKAPYLGIEKFTLALSGGQHALLMTISSVEISQ